MAERWRQLPLDHAVSCMPALRSVVQRLADEVAGVEGRASVLVPDLGAAVVMDQLAVMVFDVMSTVPERAPGLASELGELRRALA